MIIREIILINEIEYQKTYSDLGFYIEKDGIEYTSAIDPQGFYDREYIETDKLIKSK